MAEIEDDLKQNAALFARDSSDAKYVAASYFIIFRFVSRAVANAYWIAEPDGTMSGRNGQRLATLGETLFRLRETPGLIEFCQRIRAKSPHVSFVNEALIATIFLDNGFRIRAMQESGVKGKDFDLFRAEEWPHGVRGGDDVARGVLGQHRGEHAEGGDKAAPAKQA